VAGEPDEFEFSPAEFTVPVGVPVQLWFVNAGGMDHDILIPAFAFHVDAGPGDEVRGAFVAERAGSYEFYCALPGHKEAGMVGTLHVEA
jgi:nitrite reductase (NO-forming)